MNELATVLGVLLAFGLFIKVLHWFATHGDIKCRPRR